MLSLSPPVRVVRRNSALNRTTADSGALPTVNASGPSLSRLHGTDSEIGGRFRDASLRSQPVEREFNRANPLRHIRGKGILGQDALAVAAGQGGSPELRVEPDHCGLGGIANGQREWAITIEAPRDGF